MISLETLTKEVQELAPLPAAAAKLAKLAADWEADINEVVNLIKYDEALTAAVLRYANSPMGQTRYRITSIRDAVVRLGTGRVLEIAVKAHVRGQMKRALPEYGFAEHDLWRHSVAAAIAADLLVQRSMNKIPQLAFTAALLHDIGKLILARYMKPAVLRTIAALTHDYGMTYYQAETQVLKFSHAAVGAKIVREWGLGEEIANAIENHHEITASGDSITDVVRVCNIAAKTVGCGLGNEGMNLAADAGACERLGIGRHDFEALTAEVASVLPEVESLFS